MRKQVFLEKYMGLWDEVHPYEMPDDVMDLLCLIHDNTYCDCGSGDYINHCRYCDNDE